MILLYRAVTIRYPEGIMPPSMFGLSQMQRQPMGQPPSSVPLATYGTPPLATATPAPVATAPPPYSTSMVRWSSIIKIDASGPAATYE
jgi:hypothetical protein